MQVGHHAFKHQDKRRGLWKDIQQGHHLCNTGERDATLSALEQHAPSTHTLRTFGCLNSFNARISRKALFGKAGVRGRCGEARKTHAWRETHATHTQPTHTLRFEVAHASAPQCARWPCHDHDTLLQTCPPQCAPTNHSAPCRWQAKWVVTASRCGDVAHNDRHQRHTCASHAPGQLWVYHFNFIYAAVIVPWPCANVLGSSGQHNYCRRRMIICQTVLLCVNCA